MARAAWATAFIQRQAHRSAWTLSGTEVGAHIRSCLQAQVQTCDEVDHALREACLVEALHHVCSASSSLRGWLDDHCVARHEGWCNLGHSQVHCTVPACQQACVEQDNTPAAACDSSLLSIPTQCQKLWHGMVGQSGSKSLITCIVEGGDAEHDSNGHLHRTLSSSALQPTCTCCATAEAKSC